MTNFSVRALPKSRKVAMVRLFVSVSFSTAVWLRAWIIWFRAWIIPHCETSVATR